ncbi:polyphosphate kinase [Paraferrimonas sedimenticola]|uniref:Polyphosphate kinase n=1 Tax=Paraferrimonas sedimenticola TaxID=375674 RepID=A0AA37VZI9_9GAMM|nr:polyphosphate kinase [Paraferrimonas sedimenticola]
MQEAQDDSVPVIERLRFLGIFSSNLDEFYRVRVADVRRRLLIHQEQGGDPKAQPLMEAIQNKVLSLQAKFDDTYQSLLIELRRRNIYLISEAELSDFHGRWIKRYFKRKLLPLLVPIWVENNSQIAQRISDDVTYLVAQLRKGNQTRYALIDVPADETNRFVLLPKEKGVQGKSVILLDNVIRYCLAELFKGVIEFDEAQVFSMKLTRDAEFELSGDIDDSIVNKMSQGLKQRLVSEPVRYVYDRAMPKEMRLQLSSALGLSSVDAMIPGGRYHNFRDFIGFPNITGYKYLENPSIPSLESAQFKAHASVFDAIAERDVLLYYPYHTFGHFTEFVRQAAYDPQVTSIKLNIYRVARHSRIIAALLDAVSNGKEVTVVVELRARFDEEANIEWAKRLTDGGAKVEFGVASLKVHSKLCLITRQEGQESVRYAHIGTGNFHEKTARIYTDFSLFTQSPSITQEVSQVFDFIGRSYRRFEFNNLLVSPINSRERVLQMIDKEIEFAKRRRKAEIVIKVNNLVDKAVIERLYQASQAGVKVRMIIRGMCALAAGIKGLSENIKVISVVDRFLEHPRVMVFHNGGQRQVYLASFDLMTRNLDYRVEVGTPIIDPQLQQRIVDLLELQWKDTVKARVVDAEQTNAYVKRGNRRKIRSQIASYDYLKKLESKRS